MLGLLFMSTYCVEFIEAHIGIAEK